MSIVQNYKIFRDESLLSINRAVWDSTFLPSPDSAEPCRAGGYFLLSCSPNLSSRCPQWMGSGARLRLDWLGHWCSSLLQKIISTKVFLSNLGEFDVVFFTCQIVLASSSWNSNEILWSASASYFLKLPHLLLLLFNPLGSLCIGIIIPHLHLKWLPILLDPPDLLPSTKSQ